MAGKRARLTAALASVTAATVIAACGGSSTSSSVAAAGARSSSTTTISSSTTSSTTTTSSSTTSTKPGASSTQSAAVSTAAPPTPAGTPPAPAGLTQTTGYSTYELCSVHCNGAVPAALRRGLHVSGASCSSGSAAGQVTPSGSGTLHVTSFVGSKWDGGRVTWSAPASFSGPILIRGGAAGGSGAVGFGEGHVPYDELQLYAVAGKPHQWQSFTRVTGPGCYAYQVDTASGTAVISFTAR